MQTPKDPIHAMKYSPSSLITRLGSSFALGLLLLGSSVQGRLWTAADGRSLEADLIEYDAAAGTVRIKRKDGKEFTLKKDSLSAGDIAHLDAIEKERAAAREATRANAEALAGKTTSHASTGVYKVPFHVAMINGDGDKAANSWIERDTDIFEKVPLQDKDLRLPGRPCRRPAQGPPRGHEVDPVRTGN